MLQKKQEQRKKEEIEILSKLKQDVEMETIFHFANGFAFHGRVKGDKIVDNSEGVIMIHSTQENIPVVYKYVPSIQSGSFKSKDDKYLFIFRYKERKLAQVKFDEQEQVEPIHQIKNELLLRIKENIKNIHPEKNEEEESSIDLNDKLNQNVFMNNSTLSFK